MTENFPLPPLLGVDWDHLGFEPLEVNGHVECTFSTTTSCWTEPVFVTNPYLPVHGLAPGLNYGQQIFEGMKAFRNPSGDVQLFRPDQNALRFARSALRVAIPPVPTDLFLRAVNTAVGMNTDFVPPHGTGASLYIRPMAFASSPTVGLFLASQFKFCVYVLPVSPLHGKATQEGASVLVIEDFDRAAPLGTGNVKVGGNYGPVLGLIDEAKKQGFNLTLHLDSLSHSLIDEFSTSGFIGVLNDGEVPTIVVSDSQQVVSSITVDSICELARAFDWHVQKRPISFLEVARFSEVYAAGTAAVLVPVESILRRSTGEHVVYSVEYSSPTSCFSRLSTALRDIQQGLVPDDRSWIKLVTKP
ncbi:D-aminoacid aminotransferase-like PLP-dependent enzyme [Glarea lozoyensis ATCC 20868]|uniref:Transaminase gloG n=1 Tax=Glarea lozoyensis (strain ATCC 20868 / MF5171) TaxID=1116229 RepID=GLOG_GLAL2|nr:D-aminoacid aminotransferase-like PLP-dependent enzyme [Glarea lozoyensis ATCC 20868]S3DQP8.1 RecName: Full=Branched-chain amino acid aminotransferase gloG; AltName: Full=L-homotyrosine biosynthesis sub-cluster protein gloG; AltName: Full=Pneumocandin biosynthesis cluster protein G [Glarea lozoyensis ATCC 20868]EPE34346.1 D-aminoacid aminotransferase-like PLP-dependent enzyme [Glarea lozoyensis ATCC 20868]